MFTSYSRRVTTHLITVAFPLKPILKFLLSRVSLPSPVFIETSSLSTPVFTETQTDEEGKESVYPVDPCLRSVCHHRPWGRGSVSENDDVDIVGPKLPGGK